MREDETNISPKNSLTLSHQRLIAPGRTRRRGSVFAVLRRDKAGGGTRQRKREAGGTPGGVSPCKKTQNKLSPHIGNRAIKKDNGVNNCDCTMSRADVDADTAVHPVQKAGDVTFNQVLWHRQCAYSICGRASEVRPDIPSA